MNSRSLRPNEQVVYRRLGDRMVLVHLGTNVIFELNETAARLWELLSDNDDERVVESLLGQEYAVEPLELREEVQRTLSALLADDLLVETSHA